MTRKRIEVNDLSNDPNSTKGNIRFKSTILRSNPSDFSDAYIVVKGEITVAGTNSAIKKLTFKNNTLFISCISHVLTTPYLLTIQKILILLWQYITC